MSTSVKGAGLLRRLGLLGAAAIGCAALAAPWNSASGTQLATTTDVRIVPLAHDRLPAGAVPAAGARPAIGAHGAVFPAPRAHRGVTPNIVGGSTANASDYPWIVGIQTYFLGYDSQGAVTQYVSTCTGTVLSANKVLTAGHCDTDLPDGTTYVIAGRNSLGDNSSGYVAGVASTWTDQNFNLAALNAGTTSVPIDDVAVLTLQEPLPPTYTPIALTGQGDQSPYAAGTQATILGYGLTQAGGTAVGTLYQATVPIQDDTTCATAMSGYNSSTMTCAGLPTGGVDSCNGDSGGPLVVNGVEAGITDWGADDCGAAGTYGVYERLSTYDSAVSADVASQGLVNLDWTGDGHSDLMARDSSGNLSLYAGSGFVNDGYSGFGATGTLGSGWGTYSKLFRVTNWNDDDTESVMGEDFSGNLFEYTSNGAGQFTTGTPVQIGSGWNMFASIMVVNNWVGDGTADLIGITPAGAMRLYESNGQGGWINPYGVQIGSGWNMFNTVITPGIWAGDGHQALIGRTPSGTLRLYESDGQGGWINPHGVQIGYGWANFSTFMSPGDWNGDDQIDLLGINSAGTLLLYETDGHGNWLNNGQGIPIASGWQKFNAVF